MKIKEIVIVKKGELHRPSGTAIVVGSLAGPYPSLAAALRDLYVGQAYRTHAGVLYAEESDQSS